MNAKWIWVFLKTSLESTSRFLARYWQIGSQIQAQNFICKSLHWYKVYCPCLGRQGYCLLDSL